MSFYFSNKKRVLDINNTPDPKKAKTEQSPRQHLPSIRCRIPRFKKNTHTYCTTAGMHQLNHGCQIGITFNVLDHEQRATYVSKALSNGSRMQMPRSFGKMTPRRVIYYGSLEDSFGRNDKMIPYPTYVLDVERIFFEKNIGLKFLTRLTAVDNCYDSSFERGGACSAQTETAHPQTTDVVIYSVGQTRILRINDIESPSNWFNILLVDNSLVTLVGSKFQSKYTNQIDKLAVGEPVGTHISLKIFYTNKESSQ